MLPEQTDVLIVGAGPTGLALANVLQQAGVNHVLIDALVEAPKTSRAAVIHALTIEMLESIGVASDLAGKSIVIHDFAIRDRDQPLLQLNFANLPTAFPEMLMVPQTTTEAVLQDRLSECGGTTHRGISALGATVDASGAVVKLRTAQGERTIHARYVVGGDGLHSVVREAAAINFEGATYGESFVLADVHMDWPLGATEVSLFFSPAGLVVIAPLPDGSYRVVSTLDDAPEHPSLTDIQQLIDARGPRNNPALVRDVVWSSRFRVHHRLAEAYRRGPFLLMGDAAHVHSPAGGQGMNTGLVDAIVLGEALTRVLRDNAPESLLDDYARLRRPAAEEVLALASRLTRMATAKSITARLTRNLALRLLNHLPPFKRRLSLNLSGLSRRQLSILPNEIEQSARRANAPYRITAVQVSGAL
jgi:2-polyprenyl-6-methoxyphenol hydroxylase-like FAD-dependent oxidoreductase